MNFYEFCWASSPRAFYAVNFKADRVRLITFSSPIWTSLALAGSALDIPDGHLVDLPGSLFSMSAMELAFLLWLKLEYRPTLFTFPVELVVRIAIFYSPLVLFFTTATISFTCLPGHAHFHEDCVVVSYSFWRNVRMATSLLEGWGCLAYSWLELLARSCGSSGLPVSAMDLSGHYGIHVMPFWEY